MGQFKGLSSTIRVPVQHVPDWMVPHMLILLWKTEHSSAISRSLNLVCYYLVSLVWKFPLVKTPCLLLSPFLLPQLPPAPFELYLLPSWFVWVSHRSDPESPKSRLKFMLVATFSKVKLIYLFSFILILASFFTLSGTALWKLVSVLM